MSDIESLQKEYSKILESEKKLEKEKQRILSKIKSLAKFKVGDRVVWKGESWVVRGVRAPQRDILYVGYIIVTAENQYRIHGPVPEEELERECECDNATRNRNIKTIQEEKIE